MRSRPRFRSLRLRATVHAAEAALASPEKDAEIEERSHYVI
jgi:hypothetical protein